jgi:hypothetical protein
MVHMLTPRTTLLDSLQAQAARSEAAAEQQRAALIAAAVHKLAAKATTAVAPAVTSRNTSARPLQQRLTTASAAGSSSSVDQLADQHSSTSHNSISRAVRTVARSGVSRSGRRASSAGSMWSVTNTDTTTAGAGSRLLKALLFNVCALCKLAEALRCALLRE